MNCDLIELLDESDSIGVLYWMTQALGGKKTPEPLLMSGTGAEELGRAVAVSLIRDGEDVMIAPWSWLEGKLPEVLPTVLICIPGLEDVDADLLEALSKRTAVLVAGNAIPLLEGATAILTDVPRDRLADLWLHEETGYPVATC